MQKTQTITIKQEGDWILVQSPYSAEFVSRLKEEVPWKDRNWDKPYWKVKPEYLESVRALATEIAASEKWEILDYTVQTKEAIKEHKQEILQHDLDHHVAAVIDVLPKLPERALRLVDWQEGYLVFELATFLDDKELFRELAQASLKAYRPAILFGGPKHKFTHTFIVSDDERILHKLCDLAGVFSSTKQLPLSKIEYFVVRQLTVKQRFDDGIVHFTGEQDELWVGIPYREIGWDVSWSYESWEVTCIDTAVYRVFKCEKALKKLIDVKEYQYVNPGVGFAVAQSHPSYVAQFVIFTHIEEWFRAWGNELAQSEVVKKGMFGEQGWYDFQYEHAADEMLSHISFTRQGGTEMVALLGWDKEKLTTYREQVKQLKCEAAQHVIDDMKAHSQELAPPRLQALTIKDLLELGQKHGVELKKSWGKEKIVQALNTHTNVCEDIIGLTKRLEKETYGSTAR